MIHEKNRQELANAEKLFDLPITMYPELLKVQKEMSSLKAIYELYEGLKVSIHPQLWSPWREYGSADFEVIVIKSLGQISEKLAL